jgi:hypothetical protein
VNQPSEPADRTVPDDDRLMAWLAEVFRMAEPTPVEVAELARESFLLRDLDAQLAGLVEDSDDPVTAMMPVRDLTGAPPRRLLGYHFLDGRTGDQLVIAVEVESLGEVRRLSGQLTPAEPAHIEVRQPAQVLRVVADPLGRFVVADVRPGPVSMTCRRAGAPAVATQWTLI